MTVLPGLPQNHNSRGWYVIAKPVTPRCDLVLGENLASVASCNVLCQRFAAESTQNIRLTRSVLNISPSIQ